MFLILIVPSILLDFSFFDLLSHFDMLIGVGFT